MSVALTGGRQQTDARLWHPWLRINRDSVMSARFFLLALLGLASCIRHEPPVDRGSFNGELGPGDVGAAFRALVSAVNRKGYPIQSSDSGAGLLRVGPMDFGNSADCGRVTSDIDAIQLSAPMGLTTYVLDKRGDALFLSATTRVVQTVYQWNSRAFTWQPTHVVTCYSLHHIEQSISTAVRLELMNAPR